MYGNKSLDKFIIAPNGRKILNLEYFINQEQFSDLYFVQKRSLRNIVELIAYENSLDRFIQNVNDLRWRPIGRQVYGYNKEFFKRFSYDSAWVYGWLLTDGYINTGKQVGITLQEKDIDVLEKIKALIEFEGDIKTNERDNSKSLTLCKPELVQDLYNLGFPETNKTYNCEVPTNLDRRTMWNLVRGAVEGDGSVSVEQGSLRLSICGASKGFMEGIKSFLENEGVELSVRVREDGLLIYRTKNMNSALRWAYFMYSGSTEPVRMNRKFSTYTDFIRNYYDRNRVSADCIELVELTRQTIPECRDDYNAISTLKEAI